MTPLPTSFPAAEEFLPALLDLSLAGIICYTPVLDATGQVVDFDFAYLNPAAQRLLRLPAQPASSCAQQFPKSRTNGALAFHKAAFLAQEPQQFELNYQADGYDGYFRVVGRRLGGLLLVSFTMTQAQDHTAVEQALRASQTREQAARAEAERQRGELQRIFAQAPVAIAVYRGPNYVIELANPLVCALWGRTQAQAVGTPLFELLPEVAGQGYEELLAQVAATGEPYVAREMPSLIDRGGQRDTVYWNFVYLPIREEEGRVSGVMVVATEVSEQVEARGLVQALNDQLAAANQALHTSNAELLANQEEVLLVQQQLEAHVAERTAQFQAARGEAERQRARLEQLFMQAPAAICILEGPELVYELVNPGYQALFPDRKLLGKPILAALPEIADNPVYTTFRHVYETGQAHEEQALLIPIARPTDGVLENRYFKYVQQARYHAAGHIDGVLVFAFEVTEQVRARQQAEALQAQVQTLNEELAATNQELRVSNKGLGTTNYQLLRTNRDLDNFIYTASHDLKAPIANIEGLLLALRQDLPAAVVSTQLIGRLLDLIDSSIARFQQTIGHLTNLSQLHQVGASPTEIVNLAALIDDVRLDLAPVLEATGAQLVVAVGECPTIRFAPKNLRSIVYNLLSNALKYREPSRPPVVHVRAHCVGEQVELTIQDNGLGLDADQQSKLFRLFKRLHTHVEGSGVGLYTIRQIIENSGGTIAVQSELGVGTTFTVSLPR